MIPPLDDNGYLPPGVHPAELDEVAVRFGHGSEQREAQTQSLAWLAPLCLSAGILKLLINGGFVTAKQEPNDVDCVALAGPSYDDDSAEAAIPEQGLPFVELRIVNEDDYSRYRDILFASDRDMIAKGVVEVTL